MLLRPGTRIEFTSEDVESYKRWVQAGKPDSKGAKGSKDGKGGKPHQQTPQGKQGPPGPSPPQPQGSRSGRHPPSGSFRGGRLGSVEEGDEGMQQYPPPEDNQSSFRVRSDHTASNQDGVASSPDEMSLYLRRQGLHPDGRAISNPVISESDPSASSANSSGESAGNSPPPPVDAQGDVEMELSGMPVESSPVEPDAAMQEVLNSMEQQQASEVAEHLVQHGGLQLDIPGVESMAPEHIREIEENFVELTRLGFTIPQVKSALSRAEWDFEEAANLLLQEEE